MYVGVKNEESISLSSLASKNLLKAATKEGRREELRDREFYKTLRNKREIDGSKRKEKVSQLKGRDENRIKPWDKKPDFNFKPSQVKKYKAVQQSKARLENSKTEDAKRRVDFSEEKESDLQKDRKVSENEEREEGYVGLDSTDEKKAEFEDNKLSELADEEKLDSEGVDELILRLNDVFINIVENQNLEKFEEVKDLIKDFSSKIVDVDLLAESGKMDLMEGFALEELSDKLSSLNGSLEGSGELLEEVKAFSEELLQTLEKMGVKADENSVQDLLTKLNAFSLELKKFDNVSSNEKGELPVEVEKVAEGSVSGLVEDSDMNFSSDGGEKEAEVRETVKASKSAVSENLKSEEGFSLKLGDVEGVKEAEKIGFQSQKNLKAAMKTEIFEQIKNNVAKQSIGEEKSEMIINLRPEELGKIELKIQVHKDEVICKMNVASQMVKEAIEANLSDLKMSLKDKGFDVTGFDVNLSDDGSQENSSENSAYQRAFNKNGLMRVEESLDGVSERYVKSLEAMEQGSTFEELA